MTVEVTRLANGLTVATDRMDSVQTVSLEIGRASCRERV
jgi:predicted Zn-dependent peptidase